MFAASKIFLKALDYGSEQLNRLMERLEIILEDEENSNKEIGIMIRLGKIKGI